MSTLSVTIIIPTYNRAGDLNRTLDALRSQSEQRFSVLVVDNSSTDSTAEIISSQRQYWKSRLNWLVKEPNGPASARNFGLDYVDTPYTVFLDSDVELHVDWIRRALDHISNYPDIAALGGQVVYAFDKQRLNAYGGDLGTFGLAWDLLEGAETNEANVPGRRIWVNCSALLVRTPVCKKFGGFDERFFYGFEDSDFGWRLNTGGYECWVFPDLVARHHVDPEPGSTNPTIVFHYCKNRLCSVIKNSSASMLAVRLVLYASYSLVDLLWRRPRRAKLSAVLWNLRELPHTWQRRKSIQAIRTVTDAEIFSLGEERWFPSRRLDGGRRRSINTLASGLRRESTIGIEDDRI